MFNFKNRSLKGEEKMNQLLRVICLALLFLLPFYPTLSMATGIGFNLTGGSGSTDWDAVNWSHSGSDKDFDYDTDIKRAGAGILLDTAVGSNRLFNYRLNLGWENSDYKIDDVYKYVINPNLKGKFETRGWFMSHDFGFRIISNEAFRLWLGPELRISKSSGELKGNEDYEIDLSSFGIGPVLGLNLNMGKTVSLSFRMGALDMRSTGELENRSANIDWDINSDSYTYTFSSVGIIFRFGEYF